MYRIGDKVYCIKGFGISHTGKYFEKYNFYDIVDINSEHIHIISYSGVILSFSFNKESVYYIWKYFDKRHHREIIINKILNDIK